VDVRARWLSNDRLLRNAVLAAATTNGSHDLSLAQDLRST